MMQARDVYIKHTDKHGATWIQHHRVWDSLLFMQSQDDAARKEGGAIQASSEREYNQQRESGR